MRVRPPASPEAGTCALGLESHRVAGWLHVLGGQHCRREEGWSPAECQGGEGSPLLGRFARGKMARGVPSNPCPLSAVLRMLRPWSSAKGAQLRSVLEVLKAK